MIRLLHLRLLFAFIWIANVKCEDCEFTNIEYKDIFRSGATGESSDTLLINLIKASLPTLEYTLINTTLSGMKDCDVIYQFCNPNKMTFKYHLKCPRLLLNYLYKADGKLAQLLIQSHGAGSAEMIDYVIKFDGDYESVLGKDHVLRPIIKQSNYETEPIGKITYDVKNLYQGDKLREEKANKYFNDNWREMEKVMRSPIIDDFMELFIEKLNNYSKYY